MHTRIAKRTFRDGAIELKSLSSTGRGRYPAAQWSNRKVVTGRVISVSHRADGCVAIEVIAQTPRQGDPRVDVEAPSVDALVAEKINRLGVVIGVHQVAEQFLASVEG